MNSNDGDAILACVRNIFADPAFKVLPPDRQIARPNILYTAVKPVGKIGVLVSKRSAGSADWSLSRNGLDYLRRAHEEGRIVAGAIALTTDFNVVAVAMLTDVWKAVRDVTPWSGRWGQYDWIDSDFRVSNPPRAPVSSEDEAY